MFLSELDNMLLTAGHDLGALHFPLQIGLSKGTETCITMSGAEQTLKPGDMFMADQGGVISSVIFGPDQRTRLTPVSMAALSVVYAPKGIAPRLILDHFSKLQTLVTHFSPALKVTFQQIYS